MTRTYGVNGSNRLTSSAGVAITYDLRGNLSNDGATTYGYDLLNNLTSTSNGAVLAYEPAGRLWQVSANGATTNFLYSGADLVAEYANGGRTCGVMCRGRAPMRRWSGSRVPEGPIVAGC